MAAAFSTQAKSSDNFLSGQSSLYAESMLEMYENDPNSVPEVRCNINYLPDVCVFITYTYPYQYILNPQPMYLLFAICRVGGYTFRAWIRERKH